MHFLKVVLEIRGLVPQCPYQSEWSIEKGDHKVRYGKICNKQAGCEVHPFVFDHDMTDQDVAKEGEYDDKGVCHNEKDLHHNILGCCPVFPPIQKTLPIGKGVICPGKEIRDVRYFNRSCKTSVEHHWSLKRIHQIRGEEPHISNHCRGGWGLCSFAKSEVPLTPSTVHQVDKIHNATSPLRSSNV